MWNLPRPGKTTLHRQVGSYPLYHQGRSCRTLALYLLSANVQKAGSPLPESAPHHRFWEKSDPQPAVRVSYGRCNKLQYLCLQQRTFIFFGLDVRSGKWIFVALNWGRAMFSPEALEKSPFLSPLQLLEFWSVAHGGILHLQGQQHSIFKSSSASIFPSQVSVL